VRALAALTWLLVGSCGTCARPSRPFVEVLTVDAFEGGEVASMSVEQLRERLAKALEREAFVVARPDQVAPDGVQPWKVTLAAGLSEPDAESNRGPDAVVVLHLRQKGQPEGFELRTHERPALTSNDVDALEKSVTGAVDEALAQAVKEARATIELTPATTEVLEQKLTAPEVWARRAAVRLLVERHDLAALPVLLERLKSPDLTLIRETVGLLVQLKAPQSVNALIDAAHQRGPTLQREIAYAVGAIGGDDAEAFLDLVSSGSDDPSVRQAATEALSELKTRKTSRKP
jgi:hypothetical protein